MEFIKADKVRFAYEPAEGELPREVLHGVSLEIKKGEFVALLGHNGCGKSTMAKLFNGMLLPTEGKVTVEGMDTADEETIYEVRRRVGLVQQNPDNQLVASIVEEDVAFGPENLGVEPTLAEKRNMAPMMAESASLKDADVDDGKGLASTLRDEGFDSGTGRSSGGKLGGLLSSVSTPPTNATMMPDRNLLLPKGTFIDCVLETKLDTTVPGMTSCVIPRDVYSANGRVLLIERGSKAIGEYKGAVENGLNRIFVLWTQIQTPKGVRVNIDSPATDALGGSGMAGEIDFHWWARFGNALLFTLIQDGFDFAMTKQSENNGGVNYYQNSEDGMNQIIQEAMRQSGNIPPTLTKNQGERVGIFVARDVDFSKVYQLKPTSR